MILVVMKKEIRFFLYEVYLGIEKIRICVFNMVYWFGINFDFEEIVV